MNSTPALVRMLSWLAMASFVAPRAADAASSRPSSGALIVDASEFLHEIPPGDTIVDAARVGEGGAWLFNNLGLSLLTTQDAVARVNIAEAGEYHLFVRSTARSGGAFKVAINGRETTRPFGDGALALREGGTFELAAGAAEIRLTAITPAPVFDALVLTRDAQFKEADLQSMQFSGNAMLLKEYQVPAAHAVKFGDVTGDGKIDFMVLGRDYSAYVFDHDGKELWRYVAPAENTRLRAEFEAPGSVWDFDNDGAAEVIQWRFIDGKEWLVMADGRTGEIKHRVEWPTKPLPHVYNNFRTAIARLHPGRPDNLVVFTDCGGTISITAYDRELKQLWQHAEQRLKDHMGHYVYPIDLDRDGIDEVVVSHLALDAAGKTLWSNLDTLYPDNHDHCDSFRFADIDGDGELEALCPQSDIGVTIFKARTGEQIWSRPAAHAQQLSWGNFLLDAPQPQIIVNARYYGRNPGEPPGLSAQTHWFDAKGNALLKWPATSSLNGNPDFVKGDWRGDGREELFWYKFHFDAKGRGEVWFREEVYHMFDFMGNGAEQVIALNKPRGILQIYGARDAKPRDVKRDADYLRNAMANHTHY